MKWKSSLLVFAVAMTAMGGLVGFRAVHPCADCPISKGLMACGVGTCPTDAGAAIMATSFDEPKPAADAPKQEPKTAPAATPESQKDAQTKKPESVPGNVDTKSGTAAQDKVENKVKTESAMFGAGCFWGVEAIFRKQPGVVDAAVGYAGGETKNPTYKDVCTDTTGHAEVVKVEFDPAKVSYEKLVTLFFKLHDPTQVNRQGPDFGSQYRSVIFFYSPEQEKTAMAVKDQLTEAKKYKRPIATLIEKAPEFYRAEEYHQRYLEKNGRDNCHLPPSDE